MMPGACELLFEIDLGELVASIATRRLGSSLTYRTAVPFVAGLTAQPTVITTGFNAMPRAFTASISIVPSTRAEPIEQPEDDVVDGAASSALARALPA